MFDKMSNLRNSIIKSDQICQDLAKTCQKKCCQNNYYVYTLLAAQAWMRVAAVVSVTAVSAAAASGIDPIHPSPAASRGSRADAADMRVFHAPESANQYAHKANFH